MARELNLEEVDALFAELVEEELVEADACGNVCTKFIRDHGWPWRPGN